MGKVTEAELHDDGHAMRLLSRLASGYVAMDRDFVAPYLDLVA
jgi:hypothetical protein